VISESSFLFELRGMIFHGGKRGPREEINKIALEKKKYPNVLNPLPSLISNHIYSHYSKMAETDIKPVQQADEVWIN
jgi:hypothetical protein